MTKYSTLANELYPYLLQRIQKAGGRNGNGGSGGGTPPTTLSQLTDVQLTALADGDFLAYEASISKWVNVDAPSGTGGSTYTAGWGINIDVSDVISVDVPEIIDINAGLEVVANKIAVNLQTSSGFVVNSSGLALDSNLAGDGLSMTAGKIMSVVPAPSGGLAVDSTGVFIELRSVEDGGSGLHTGIAGLSLRDDMAGVGLAWGLDNRILAVGAGNGITVATDSVAVNQAFDFTWTGTHIFNDDVTINADGTFNTGVFRFNTDPQINANLDFIGTARSITSAATLTITPTGNLHLDPSANITMPNAQTYRSTTINDLPTGIDGMNIFNRSDFSPDYVQMTIGAIKSDELHVRIFTADETRINRAEEYWSKSFGIVQEDFSVPGVGVNVDVWFEDAPAMTGVALFAANDWLLMRSINWGTGLIVSKVWFQVVGTKLAQETTAVHGVDRQQWRLVRRAGGWTTTGASNRIKAGNVMLDAGQVGQGWVHLSALANDGGPFIQFGKMTSISTTPLHSNYVRIGNLKNAVGYSVDTWGMAAGNNLGLDPNLGTFKGFVIEGEQGLSLYNTDLHIYDGATRVLGLTNTNGLTLAHDVDGLTDTRRQIAWYDDINLTTDVPRSMIGSYVFDNSGVTTRQMEHLSPRLLPGGASIVAIRVLEPSASRDADITLRSRDELSTGATGSTIELFANEVQLKNRLLVGSELDETGAISVLQVSENSAVVNQLAGFTIQQRTTGGVGDAVMHFYLSAPGMYVSAGIDNSDGDKFKITYGPSLGGTGTFFVYDPVTDLVTLSGLSGGGGGGGTPTVLSGDGIQVSGGGPYTVAVNSSVVRTTLQNIVAGPGLTGGGLLNNANVTLSVNAGSGLELVSAVPGAALRINLATNSGLNTTSGLAVDAAFGGDGLVLTAGVLDIIALSTGGLQVNANNIHIKLPTISGLQTDATGLWIKRRDNDTTSSGIHVNAAGLVLADTVAGAGLEWTTSTERILQISAGGGLEFSDATVDANLRVKLPADSGLIRDATGLYIDPLLAGDGMVKNASGQFDVVALSTGGLSVSANSIQIKLRTVSPGSGLRVDADGLSIQRRGSLGSTSGIGLNTTDGMFLADSVAGAGLEWSSSTDRFLQIAVGGGLEFSDATVDATVRVKLPSNSGLVRDTTGIYIDDALAGQGLTMSASKVLNVIAANTSIIVASDDIRVNTAHAFTWTAQHTFMVTPEISANLHFIAANRSITTGSAYMLTLAPGGDLKLDPTGLILLPNAQEARTETFNDFVAVITGLRHWDTGGNYRQLTIGKIKADELHVRVFSADEQRVSRGAEFWAYSFGIVETTFTIPALAATVDVWFEEAPDLGAFKLFRADDWIIFRIVDAGTGLTVLTPRFQIVDADGAGLNDWVQRQDASDVEPSHPSRQQWRLIRRSGGTTGVEVKKGAVGVDFGRPASDVAPLPGQGVVHLSALNEDGGPFIQIQTFESVVANIPQFKNRVRMGNLTGTVDYSADTWGFAAGNDLSIVPSAGFSGLVADATNGLRLFNTDINLYSGATKVVALNKDDGLVFKYGNVTVDPINRITWATDVDDPTDISVPFAYVGSYTNAGNTFLRLLAFDPVGEGSIQLSASGLSTSGFLEIGESGFSASVDGTGIQTVLVATPGNRTFIGQGSGRPATASVLHIYENTSSTGATTGLTVEQDGAGDAAMQFYLTAGQYWSVGIDNSVAGDPFRISASADLGSSSAFFLSTAGALTVPSTMRADGGFISDKLSALTSAGLRIEDDGANLGIFVQDATGYVGIGTASPVARLNVVEATITEVARFTSTFGGSGAVQGYAWIGLEPRSSGLTYPSVRVGAEEFDVTDFRGNLLFQTRAGTTDVVPTTKMVVMHDGFVGIGTVAPSALLHLFSSSTAGTISRVENDAAAGYANLRAQNDAGGFFQFTAWGSDFSGSNLGTTRAGKGMLLWGGTATDMVIGTELAGALGFSTTAVRRMTITADGLVGIGDPAPEAQLDIVQTPSAGLRITSAAETRIVMRRSLGTAGSPSQVTAADNLLVLGAQGYTSSGWPAAGSYSASIKLVATQSHTSSAKGTGIEFYVTANGASTPALGAYIGDNKDFFAYGVYASTGSVVPNVTVEASGRLVRTTHVNSSLRYKEDVQTIEPDAYADLFDALRPVTYKLKPDYGGNVPGARRQVGLIAEDVEAAGGELFIQYDHQGRPDVLMYDRLIPLLILEIRRLKREMAQVKEAELNRRNFFGTIGGAIAGLVLGGNVKAAGANLEFVPGRGITLDSSGGITGLRLWNHDDLYARVFIADETRVGGGAVYWDDEVMRFTADEFRWTAGIDGDSTGDRYKIQTNVDDDDWYGAWL